MSETNRHVLGWHADDLSDFELRLVVVGRSIMKKRSMIPRNLGGRTRGIGPNGKYTTWEKSAWHQLVAQWSAVFREPIPKRVELNMRVITYLPNLSGWPDLSATYEGPQDVFEAHRAKCKPDCRRHSGIYTNDTQVFGHVGSERRVDKERPRVEITLTAHRRGDT